MTNKKHAKANKLSFTKAQNAWKIQDTVNLLTLATMIWGIAGRKSSMIHLYSLLTLATMIWGIAGRKSSMIHLYSSFSCLTLLSLKDSASACQSSNVSQIRVQRTFGSTGRWHRGILSSFGPSSVSSVPFSLSLVSDVLKVMTDSHVCYIHFKYLQ